MKIKGLQKVTLVDYPGKIACTIFLFGCNFRCGFCYNPDLVLKDVLPDYPFEEVLNFLEKRKGVLEGVCITGGEPLMTIDKNFLIKIKDLGYPIKLDTNGSYPEKLKELIDDGLIDFVAMDLKSSREKYLETISSNIDIVNIENSIKTIHFSGIPYEFRTTVVPEIHNEEEIRKIGIWIKSLLGEMPKDYFLQGFKKEGRFIDDKYSLKENIGENYLNKIKEVAKEYFNLVQIRV